MDFHRVDAPSQSCVNWYLIVVKASMTQPTHPSQQNTCIDATLLYTAEDSVLTGLTAVLTGNLSLQNPCSNLAEKVKHFVFTSQPFISTQVSTTEISVLTFYLLHLATSRLLSTQEILWFSIMKKDLKTKTNLSPEHNQDILKGVFLPF